MWHGTQGNEAEEQLESMRAEMHTLQQELEHARSQAAKAAELQDQVPSTSMPANSACASRCASTEHDHAEMQLCRLPYFA